MKTFKWNINNHILRVQLYWFRLHWKNGDFYIDLPTVFRVVIQPKEHYYGVALSILGIGAGMDLDLDRKMKIGKV